MGPSRRPAFSIHNATGIQLSAFTISNYFIGQAEALLVRGEQIVIDRMDQCRPVNVSQRHPPAGRCDDSTLSHAGVRAKGLAVAGALTITVVPKERCRA